MLARRIERGHRMWLHTMSHSDNGKRTDATESRTAAANAVAGRRRVALLDLRGDPEPIERVDGRERKEDDEAFGRRDARLHEMHAVEESGNSPHGANSVERVTRLANAYSSITASAPKTTSRKRQPSELSPCPSPPNNHHESVTSSFESGGCVFS